MHFGASRLWRMGSYPEATPWLLPGPCEAGLVVWIVDHLEALSHLSTDGSWDGLAVFLALPASAQSELDLAPGWMGRWTTTCRVDGVEVTRPLGELAQMSSLVC